MQKYVIALYIRLSIEDYKYDSLSIENQSLVLHEYAASMPETMNAEITEFIDNGYSGTNFERPQVQRLIELVRANQIDCIIVKDFSRFGRNSICPLCPSCGDDLQGCRSAATASWVFLPQPGSLPAALIV